MIVKILPEVGVLDEESIDLNTDEIDLNDALAIGIGLDLFLLRKWRLDVPSLIHSYVHLSRCYYAGYQISGPDVRIGSINSVGEAFEYVDFVNHLHQRLSSEIDRAVSGQESPLDLIGITQIEQEINSENARFTQNSFINWAEREGITIPFIPANHAEQEPATDSSTPIAEISSPRSPTKESTTVTWEQVIISIHRNYNISVAIGDKKICKKSFSEIGLAHRTTHQPNHQGGILIGLAMRQSFGHGKVVNQKDRTAISRLRNVLKKLVGIDTDPFKDRTPSAGYLPRFKLHDTRNDADARAQRSAIDIGYDDNQLGHTPYYTAKSDQEDQAGQPDLADDFLRKHDPTYK